MEKSYFKNKYRLRRLAKICNWPPGYRKPAMYPVVGVWGYLTESLFIITYVYQWDFNDTSTSSHNQQRATRKPRPGVTPARRATTSQPPTGA